MASKAKERQVGEYAPRSAKSTFSRGPGGTHNVGYSADNVTIVDIGSDNPAESKRTKLENLTPLYGGAGPQEDVPGNVSPRPGGPDRSYRNPRGR